MKTFCEQQLMNADKEYLVKKILNLSDNVYKLRPFLFHKPNCALNKQNIMTNAQVSIPCNCGYSEIINKAFY